MATWDSRANELFLDALDCAPDDRAAFLDAVCANDPVLRARVEALLAADGQVRDFLERPAGAVASERPGPDRLGPYKLLQKIGEGGMGTVWMAEQAEPVRRTVAVKVIRSGDSARVAARFEAERQALALMDHPNIAKVLDAGSTPDGRPFFAMELVKGLPITTFCDERQLLVHERLGLFVQVCRAVHHAHQKGVIHRDIKPSNVMVALYDGRPVPKVIDFGLAKATGPKLTDKTLFTEFGTVIGTLEYMSPEQAELNQLDVDTRTDVYSLGVLLYELLTGTTPLERQKLGSLPLLEVLRQVREGDTPRPSTRLSTANTLPTIAAARGIDPCHLAGLLKGELDWIAMTALEKDRERRYESPAALAADVERYLRDETVQACPPSVWYRVRKFVRRHRRGLIACAAAVLVLTVAMGSVGWALWDRESRRASAAADTRSTAERELDKIDVLLAARKRIDAEAAWERAASATASAPTDALAARLAEARERLDFAARDEKFVAGYEALTLAPDRSTVGDTIKVLFPLAPDDAGERRLLADYGLGTDTDPAAAAAIVRGRPAEVRWYLLAALYRCALASSEPPGDPGAARWFARVLDATDDDPWRRALRATFGRTDPAAIQELLRTADPRRQHPVILVVAYNRAIESVPRAAREFLYRIQTVHPGDAGVNGSLGLVLMHDKAPQKALPYLTAALALRPGNPVLLVARADAYRLLEQPNEALTDVTAAVDAAPRFLPALCLHAELLLTQKDTAGGEAAARRAIAVGAGKAPPHLLLGKARHDAGDRPGALAAFRAAVAADPKSAEAHTFLGNALRDQGDIEGALTAYRAGAAADPGHARSRIALGVTLSQYQKDLAGAAAALREALAIDSRNENARSNLVRLLILMNDHALAVPLARVGVEQRPRSVRAHIDLAAALAGAGKSAEALDAYRTAVLVDPKDPLAHTHLGFALLGPGVKDLAASAAASRRAVELDPNSAQAWGNLGVALMELGEPDKAVAAYRRAVDCDPTRPIAHASLGNGLRRMGDRTGALAAYREAARLDPKYPNAAWTAATLAFELKRWREARDGWAEVTRTFPESYNAHHRVGVLSVLSPDPALDDPALAAASARKLLDLGRDAMGWQVLAWAEYRKGEWKAALAAAEKAHTLGKADSVNPLNGYLLALAHHRLGNAAEARQWYEKTEAAKPDLNHPAVACARAEAAELLGIDTPKK